MDMSRWDDSHQAEIRIKIFEEDRVVIQNMDKESMSRSVEHRVDRLEESIEMALDDLQVTGGGECMDEEMDRERLYQTRPPNA